MPVAARTRILLGRQEGLVSRSRVYRTRDAIEMDEGEGYELRRRRVFYDDVEAVTYHKMIGWPFVVALAAAVGVASFFSLAMGLVDHTVGVLVWLATALPALVALVLRLMLRLDVVTVHGRRTRARVAYWFRKGRARQVYATLCRLVTENQRSRRAASRGTPRVMRSTDQASSPPPLPDFLAKPPANHD